MVEKMPDKFKITQDGMVREYKRTPSGWQARVRFMGRSSGWTSLDATDAEVDQLYKATH